MFKRILSCILAVVLFCVPVFGGYVENTVTSPINGSIGGEWAVIGMLGAGTATDGVKTNYLNNLEASLKECGGVLSERKYTEYSRTVIALNLLGENPSNFRGYDLVTPLLDKASVEKQGINGTIFALIALTGSGSGSELYKTELLSSILEAQGQDGSILYGGQPSCDVTAMALIAMSPYTDRAEVKSAVDKAVNALSAMLSEDGLVYENGVASSESVSQLIIGLSAVGVDAEKDPRFVKNGTGMVSKLALFEKDGGYSHVSGGDVNAMASEQALCANGAYKYFCEGKAPLYYPEHKTDTAVNPFGLAQRLLEVIGL
jgi:hypothetical protein